VVEVTVLLLMLACHKAPPPEPVSPPETTVSGSESERDRLVRALSVRDAPPSCADIEALAADPVPALLDVVNTVQMPPAAPMRAAACLLDGHGSEIGDHIVSWMDRTETRGLAVLAASRIDTLPDDVALRVASAGVAGPNAAALTEHFSASRRAEVRALVPSP
jgi:hypothetical protein